jgi:para-aminobenzoate synthetase component 1
LNLREKLNFYGSIKEPFFFIINFDLTQYDVIPLVDLPNDILYQIEQKSEIFNKKLKLDIDPIKYDLYKIKFEEVQNEILNGNTYLLNLTTQTNIKTKIDLKDIYKISDAKFKLYYKNKFVCFSPERFIEINNNKIFTYPMKGTISADLKDAKQKILADQKELAEHTMIVDLLRNDLSIVSSNVKVENFRYIDKIKAGDRELLQVSSKISGNLKKNWQKNIGDILTSLLPAGSITGTPKKRTVDIIKSIEQYNRGYFTGIFGIFDGDKLDSGVMIRFIEKKQDDTLVYKSGGGITSDSDLYSEYQEMLNKVYT